MGYGDVDKIGIGAAVTEVLPKRHVAFDASVADAVVVEVQVEDVLAKAPEKAFHDGISEIRHSLASTDSTAYADGFILLALANGIRFWAASGRCDVALWFQRLLAK